ncbi:hypothetical protein LMG33818_002594 [Halomonadaceae bacterium LMG 33818]|uniref:DUF416 family protein n=1 Tax=Cernens ardua TaxID=3402176 RepID=UPI003EDB6CA6
MTDLSDTELFASIDTRVSQLNDREATVFVAVLSDRMLNNFRLYDALTHDASIGDDARPRVDNIMALVWESLITKEARINFELQQVKLSEVNDALDAQVEVEGAGFGLHMAQDALLALSICLESTAGNRPGAALEVSRLSRSGALQMIRLSEGNEESGHDESSELQRIEWNNALLEDEADFQGEVLAQLASEPLASHPLDKTALKALKQLGYNEGVSNIGLTLDEE